MGHGPWAMETGTWQWQSTGTEKNCGKQEQRRPRRWYHQRQQQQQQRHISRHSDIAIGRRGGLAT